MQFKLKHPEHKIGQRSFEYIKPSFIRPIKDIERNVCCCRHHVEIVYLKEALNAMRGEGSTTHHINACSCTCTTVCRPSTDGHCQAGKVGTFKSLTSMWSEILCDKGDNEWHQLKCIRGDCLHSGLQKLRFCPLEISDELPSAHVRWKKFGYETLGVNKKGNLLEGSQFGTRTQHHLYLSKRSRPK